MDYQQQQAYMQQQQMYQQQQQQQQAYYAAAAASQPAAQAHYAPQAAQTYAAAQGQYQQQQQQQPQQAVAAPAEAQGEAAMSPQDALEERDGVRYVWAEWPLNKVDQERAVFKQAGLYTPLKPLASPSAPQQRTGVVMYDPVRCKNANCQAVLNPWAQVDLASKTWGCPLCGQRNGFPPHYAQHISETNLPAELLGYNTTIEYQLPTRHVGPPVFLFVVDTAIQEEELDALKDSLQQGLTLLPPDALVGLVTFEANIHVHEIGFHAASASATAAGALPGGGQNQPPSSQPSMVCSKAYVFRGDKVVPPERIFQMLGVSGAAGAGGHQAGAPGAAPGATAARAATGLPPGVERFLAPVQDVASALDTVIEDLCRDSWPTHRENRPQRCTGVALAVAVTMLEKMCPKRGARIMLFMGGPPTVGEGAVAEERLEVAMRSHTDIEKGRATLLKPAKAFYERLTQRLVENCHVVDVFICSLDQAGLLEMKTCIEMTGGYVVMADSFGQSVFKESFRRVFARHADTAHELDRGRLVMGLAATLEIVASPEVKIKGAIGPLCTLNKKGPSVSEFEVGQGGTWAWRIGALDPTTTVAVYYDTTNNSAAPGQRPLFVQYITHYQHANGRQRVRVTTTAGVWQQDATNIRSILHSFDQLAAVVCMARVAVSRIETEAPLDIIRFMDRSLIRFCGQFASYRKNDPQSFVLPAEFALLPQFLFHLRRSPFMQAFNSSPDEAAYHRMTLVRENTSNSVVMIQPSLVEYSLDNPYYGKPVLLDATSIRVDTVLLLDAFFLVVVFHGENVAAWRDQGYADAPGYEKFRAQLHQPRDDAQVIMQGRIPQPRYIVCDQHKSQSRFLVSKVNPSVTHNTADGEGAGQTVFTDDASFKSFMEHLKQLATQD